ncbi:hypothetical protein BH09MYX1_BH09MYX1_09040 [soil metagenome]
MRLLMLAAISFAFTHGRVVAMPQMHVLASPVITTPAPVTAPVQTVASPKVILVTIDGTMWQDVVSSQHGALPTLERWMTTDGALVGADEAVPMEASGPNFVSQPGYTEIFTGRPSACTSNGCARTTQRTLVDDLPDGTSFAVVASWERIALAATSENRAGFISCGRSQHSMASSMSVEQLARSMEGGEPTPGVGDYRPDANTIDLALEALRTDRPTFLFVGLGDTDEHAHHGDHAAYLRALGSADAFLGTVETILDDDGDAASTTILVTVDHGRSDDFRDHGDAFPESRRVWLVAHGAGIGARGAVTSPTPRRLADVAPTVRALLRMPPVTGPGAGKSLDELALRGSADAAAMAEHVDRGDDEKHGESDGDRFERRHRSQESRAR